jgi:Response regulator of the LytR/AlgR family
MSKQINVLIIDDEAHSRASLRAGLISYPNIKIIGEASSSQEGSSLILSAKPELLFLDVEMPGRNGIQLLRDLQAHITWPLKVIFYTAYDKYLLDALRSSAFDFLLKPLDRQELSKVLERFMVDRERTADCYELQLSLLHILPSETSFMVATVKGFQVLQVHHIGYFTYHNDRKLWSVALLDGKEIMLKRNTNAKDILGYSGSFVQISQKQIINISYLAAIDGRRCQLYPPFDRIVDLEISRGCLKDIQMRYSMI